MKDYDFKLLRGFADSQTDGPMNEQTDICDCKVAFTTEKGIFETSNCWYFCPSLLYVYN